MNSFVAETSVALIINASAGQQVADRVVHMFNAAQRRRYRVLTIFRDDSHDTLQENIHHDDLINFATKGISSVAGELYTNPEITFIWVSRTQRERPFFHQQVNRTSSTGYCVFPPSDIMTDDRMFHWLSAFMVHLVYLKDLPGKTRKHNAGSNFCLNTEIKNHNGEPTNLILNDICYSCCNQRLSQINVNDSFNLLTDFLETNRLYLLQRSKLEALPQKGALKITNPTFDIAFPALNNRKVAFTPLEKVVYFLFLHVEEGIHLSDIGLYQDWMEFIYARIASSRSKVRINKHIRYLCDSSDNSISEKISRIRLKLEAVGGKAFADRFCIKGKRGGVKRIDLDRSSIITDNGTSIILASSSDTSN